MPERSSTAGTSKVLRELSAAHTATGTHALNRPTPDPILPGQESAWHYPRQPRIEVCAKQVRVLLSGRLIAESNRVLRVLEASHPPSYYLPPDDVVAGALSPAWGTSTCRWKGVASYWVVSAGSTAVDGGAWSYETPLGPYSSLAGYVSFFASVFECFVDGERARPQPGNFHGGWITDDVVGPFKGAEGSKRW